MLSAGPVLVAAALIYGGMKALEIYIKTGLELRKIKGYVDVNVLGELCHLCK